MSLPFQRTPLMEAFASLRRDLIHEDGPRIMAELAAAYGGPWNEIRANLDVTFRLAAA